MSCTSTVRVWYNEKNVPVKYKLFCEGTCDDSDDKPCKAEQSTEGDNKQVVVTQACLCKDGAGGEPAECRIVLVTVKKPPNAAGETTMHCRGNNCGAGKKCVPVPVLNQDVPIPDKDGGYTGKMGKWIDFRCSCQPVDDAWPV
jgi:hypothetical protein